MEKFGRYASDEMFLEKTESNDMMIAGLWELAAAKKSVITFISILL